jgi:hypothetical protein
MPKKIKIQLTGELSCLDDEQRRKIEEILETHDGKTVEVADLSREIKLDFMKLIDTSMDRDTVTMKLMMD